MHQTPQLADFLRRQPDPRQVAHTLEVGQHPRVGVVRLVRALLHPRHVTGMRQVHRPASGDQLICQPRCPAARFNGRLHAHAFPAAPPNGSYHGSPIIGAALIEQHLAVARHDTHLHRRRVIIQTDKHRFRGYTAHACCSWHKGNGTHTLGLPGQQALSSPSLF